MPAALAAFLEHRDRTRFVVTCYVTGGGGAGGGGAGGGGVGRAERFMSGGSVSSLGGGAGAAAPHRFVDLSGLDDLEAAKAISGDGVHLLVDLHGFTRGARQAVFALRPAPIQCSSVTPNTSTPLF
jgi:hypothetical protein